MKGNVKSAPLVELHSEKGLERRKEERKVGHKERGRKDNTLYRDTCPKVSAQIHGYTKPYIILGQKIPHFGEFCPSIKILRTHESYI